MLNYILTIFVILLVNFSTHASWGEVVKLRGKSTILLPHKLKARNLKKGDLVVEDSSIVTQKKTFVQIKMSDGSKVTIGPSSKMVLSIENKNASLFSLLKGKLRIKAKRKDKKHLFIKTRTASLGVRGTDFVVNYTPKSNRTSILTFEGNVAIAKDSTQIITSEKKEVKKKIIEDLDKLLDEKVIHVKKSDFTSIGLKESKPIAPVKINPTQFILLRKDESLGTIKQRVDLKQLREERKILLSEIKAKNLGEHDLIHGGLISQDDGIYVPPKDIEAKERVGKITSNGKFIAPKGLKLDSALGFVAKNSQDEESKQRAIEINESLGKQVISDPDDPRYNRYFNIE